MGLIATYYSCRNKRGPGSSRLPRFLVPYPSKLAVWWTIQILISGIREKDPKLMKRLLGKWRNPNLLTPWFHILISTFCKYCVTFSFATYILIISIWVLKQNELLTVPVENYLHVWIVKTMSNFQLSWTYDLCTEHTFKYCECNIFHVMLQALE